MTTQTGRYAVHAAPNPLGTYGFHAILTHKQADVLSYLYCEGDPGPATCRELANDFHTLQSDDIADGYQVHYAPPSYASMYATLRTLEGRGLVRAIDHLGNVGWELTPSGADAARRYCT